MVAVFCFCSSQLSEKKNSISLKFKVLVIYYNLIIVKTSAQHVIYLLSVFLFHNTRGWRKFAFYHSKLPVKQGFLLVIFMFPHKGLFSASIIKENVCYSSEFTIHKNICVFLYDSKSWKTFVRGRTPDIIPQEIIISSFICYDKTKPEEETIQRNGHFRNCRQLSFLKKMNVRKDDVIKHKSSTFEDKLVFVIFSFI